MIAIKQNRAHAHILSSTTNHWVLAATAQQGYALLVTRILNFLHDDQGHDLIEYALLMAFVALASAVLFAGTGGNIAGVWTASSTPVEVASTPAR
jgi:Flp pilus assembly pilin Flp